MASPGSSPGRSTSAGASMPAPSNLTNSVIRENRRVALLAERAAEVGLLQNILGGVPGNNETL